MKTISKILILSALGSLSLLAQTATPNTTLCGAQTATQTSVCLQATTGVVNQTGVFIDQEYELVQLSNNQVVCTGPCQVPVSRANRGAKTGPTAHLNGSVAWLELTPGQTVVPGATGFNHGTAMGSIGPCTRAMIVYLPAIYVNLGIKRDCDVGGTLAAGQAGVWIDYAPAAGLDYPSPNPPINLATNGALSVSSGVYVITKAGVLAVTLAAPTATVQDGMIIMLTSTTANAHTLTATSLLDNGGSGVPYTTATFGAHAGAYIRLKAYQGLWYVLDSSNVTLS